MTIALRMTTLELENRTIAAMVTGVQSKRRMHRPFDAETTQRWVCADRCVKPSILLLRTCRLINEPVRAGQQVQISVAAGTVPAARARA